MGSRRPVTLMAVSLRLPASLRFIATRSTPWRIAFPLRCTGQGFCQFDLQLRKIALNPAFAAYQYVVCASDTLMGENSAQQFAKAPLHAIADNRVTNFFGDSDSEPHGILTARSSRCCIAVHQ